MQYNMQSYSDETTQTTQGELEHAVEVAKKITLGNLAASEVMLDQEAFTLPKVTRITEGIALEPREAVEAAQKYNQYRDENDEAVKIGLYGEDLGRALSNTDSMLIHYAEGDKSYVMPLLVPSEELEWYNMNLLKRSYGKDTKFYYFAHPLIPRDEGSQSAIFSAIKQKLEEGSVIFLDHYRGRSLDEPTEQMLSKLADKYQVKLLGGGESERRADTFAGPVQFGKDKIINNAPSLLEAYQQGLIAGEITYDDKNGPSLVDVITGEEAEKIWQFYEAPFDKLSQDHPMNAGFDKEGLLAILQDPNVAKIVNRVEGKITTLCFFVQDFDQCPWFNKQYYQEKYPEYSASNNILIFPGIVTDETMKGSSYSFKVIKLATQVVGKRGSDVLVTFECTETSAQYIPKIVTAAINRSKVGMVTGLDNPISITEYLAVHKPKQLK